MFYLEIIKFFMKLLNLNFLNNSQFTFKKYHVYIIKFLS